VSGLAEDDMNNKLQMMMTTVHTMRAAIGNLKDDYNALKTNITKLSNMTRYQEFNTNTGIVTTFADWKNIQKEVQKMNSSHSQIVVH
jgi:hypothetical protein